MDNQNSNGSQILYTNSTGTAIDAGAMVEIAAGYNGIAANDIPNGETGVLAVDIEATVPVHSTSAGFTQGVKAYYTSRKATSLTTGTAMSNTRPAETIASGVTTLRMIFSKV